MSNSNKSVTCTYQIYSFSPLVVVKVELQNRGGNGTTSVETQLLHHRISDLWNKTKPRLHQTDILISQLKDKGIEILNCQLDRHTVVVWIWCRSQAAIEYIQKLYESNELTDILSGIANIRHSASEVIQSIEINIDRNLFKKRVGKLIYHKYNFEHIRNYM